MTKPLLILKTGELPRAVTAQCGRYEQAFFNVLGPARCVVVDARKETLPEPDWAGIIVTGSPASANDPDSWVNKSEDFLKRAADQAVPIYGICFGHQHVAHALGGTIEKNPHGWELGTVTVSLTPDGRRNPLFSTVPESFPAQQSHGEIVTALPPGATALAHNESCPYQAFSLGTHIWGTQFHPEFTPRDYGRADCFAGGCSACRVLPALAVGAAAVARLAAQDRARRTRSPALPYELCLDCYGAATDAGRINAVGRRQ